MSNNQVASLPESGPLEENSGGKAAPPLIITKIRVPRPRADLLSRRRLIDFVHAHLDRRLILISAPAGYGKTSLLASFADDTDLPVCWYTLDPFDNDLRTFLEHLIAAIAHRFPAFGERSRTFLKNVTDPASNLYPFVATLVQEIYDVIPEYFVLVLDDHHTVEEQEQISEFLDLFVTYVDENCHLILASRTLPALPNLSLLVARRQAAGLSVDELRFTPEEIQSLAEQNYGLKLSLDQANVLAKQTGGWITGLLLTAVPRWEQARREVSIQGRVNVDLYDYLSKQVLDQQPGPLRSFLLDSSVLDELSQALCSEVLGIDRPAEFMEQLRTRNLFVVEFEGDDGRLRYHDLFREFLRTTLQRLDERRFRQLTRGAAKAYAEHGEWERAVSRYLALQEYESVTRIVEQIATDLFEAGRWDTLAGWIDALPEENRLTHPRLLLHRGKIYAERGQHALATELCTRAECVFAMAGDRAMAAYALAMKGYVLRFQGQYTEAVACGQEALVQVDGATRRERLTMALAYKNVGLCQFRLGQLAEGRESLGQALHLYESLGDVHDRGSVHHDIGLGYELAGDLEMAAEHYQAALGCWQQLGNPGPWAMTLNSLGVIHYLRGEYDSALDFLEQALSRAQQAGSLRVEAYVWASLGDLHKDVGAYERARQAYSEGLKVATRARIGFVVTYSLNGLGNITRQQGNLVQARRRLLDALKEAEQHDSAYEIGLSCTSLGILASEENDLAEARFYLTKAIELFEAGGFKQELGRAYLHRAQVSFLAGNKGEALVNLEHALRVSRELGFDQFLVVEGQRFLSLLRYAVKQRAGDKFLPQLLERIEAHKARVIARPEPVIQDRPAPALAIYALGQPRVEIGGQSVQWPVAQSRDFLFCLLQYSQGLRKDEMAQVFWPEHSQPRLDGIFRSTLYRLRRALFRESIIFEAGVYRFNWESDYWYDVEAFESLVNQGERTGACEEKIAMLEQALTLYRGDYLEGLEGEWCVAERGRLRGRFQSALEALAGLYADRGELPRAVELYRRILAQDPYQEIAHRELMSCYYRLGDRAAAIRQYRTCVEILREDLGLSPAPDTEAMYLRIIA
jgi:LuxR family maltose regulon positive regulatory protein